MGEDHEDDEVTTILIRWNRTGVPLLLGTCQIIKTRNISRRKKGDFGSRPKVKLMTGQITQMDHSLCLSLFGLRLTEP